MKLISPAQEMRKHSIKSTKRGLKEDIRQAKFIVRDEYLEMLKGTEAVSRGTN